MTALILAFATMLLTAPVPVDEYTVLMEVTAYCPCAICCGIHADVPFDERRTAGGYLLKEVTAMVAAPREYAYETVMSIPGYACGRPVYVLDRGGVITENKLDVYFWDHDLARQWGTQMLWVKVRMKP